MKTLHSVLPALLLVACTTTMTGASAQDSVDRKILLQLVNEVRKKGCQCGDTWYSAAPPLAWNEQLAKAAEGHSIDMRDNKYFSHTAPDGSNAGERMERAGYQWTAYGENIASGPANEKAVIADWLSSPGHCKNIMNKNYREMGIGRAGRIWTQVFGSR